MGKHIKKEDLIEYVYSEAEPAKVAAIEAHIKECAQCGKLAAQYVKIASDASGFGVDLSEAALEKQRRAIVNELNKEDRQGNLGLALRRFFTTQKLAYALSLMLLVGAGAGAGIYKSKEARESKAMATQMEMLQDLEMLERLEFYKAVSEETTDKNGNKKEEEKEKPGAFNLFNGRDNFII